MTENIGTSITAAENNSNHLELFLAKFLKISKIMKAHNPNLYAYTNIYHNGAIIDGLQICFISADDIVINIHHHHKYNPQDKFFNMLRMHNIEESETNIFVHCGNDIKMCSNLICELIKFLNINLNTSELSYSIVSTYSNINIYSSGAFNRDFNIYEDIYLDANGDYCDPSITDDNLITHFENHRLTSFDANTTRRRFNIPLGFIFAFITGIAFLILGIYAFNNIGKDHSEDTISKHYGTYTFYVRNNERFVIVINADGNATCEGTHWGKRSCTWDTIYTRKGGKVYEGIEVIGPGNEWYICDGYVYINRDSFFALYTPNGYYYTHTK